MADFDAVAEVYDDIYSAFKDDIPFYKKQKRIVLGDNDLLDPTQINGFKGGPSLIAKDQYSDRNNFGWADLRF